MTTLENIELTSNIILLYKYFNDIDDMVYFSLIMYLVVFVIVFIFFKINLKIYQKNNKNNYIYCIFT